MRRNYWVVVASMVVMTVVSGCSDTVVSPTMSPSSAPAPMLRAPSGRPTLSLSGGGSVNTSADFSVGPAGGVFFVGNHAVVFPSHSICDPATSSYGPDSWDEPCSTLETPIAIHAEVRQQDGRAWVDFTPQLRFAPASSPARWVWLFMHTPEARGAQGDLSRFAILYAESIGGVTVNDAANDPTLRTYVDTWSGTSFRRIKHFSGYAGSIGFTCDPNVETCDGGGEPGVTP